MEGTSKSTNPVENGDEISWLQAFKILNKAINRGALAILIPVRSTKTLAMLVRLVFRCNTFEQEPL
jgi:hypothetical protein